MTIETIREKVIPVLKKYQVVKASLFGSWVRGEQKPGSDIDLLVEFTEGKSLFDLVNLENDLEEILENKVDVLTYASIHPRIKAAILSEHEVFYEKEPETVP
ncbi:nucleotidyltransferase family protein [candidate division KSB1 bacterium]|nr:nucleotidyltransferase family protein [candidate division KSB1 bacterium]